MPFKTNVFINCPFDIEYTPLLRPSRFRVLLLNNFVLSYLPFHNNSPAVFAQYMKFLERYKSTLQFKVDKSPEFIAQKIAETTKRYKVDGNEIEIFIKPSFFDGSGGRGSIHLEMKPDTVGNHTQVICDITPLSITPTGIYLWVIMLLIWTASWFLFAWNLNSLIAVAVGWMVVCVYLHLTQTLNSGKLENYIIDVFKYI